MESREYWEQRAIEELLMSERSVVDYEKRLKDSYTVALKNIKRDIQAFYERYAQQNKITYSEARKRLDAKEFKEFQAIISKWNKEARENKLSVSYKDYLAVISKRKYITRLESLESEIRYEIEILENQKVQEVTTLLEDNYTVMFYICPFNIAKSTQVKIKLGTLDAKGVERAVHTKWAQNSFSQNVWADRDKLIKTMGTIIPQSFSRGLNSRELGDMIAKEMNVSQNRGRTLARTEVNRICNIASIDSYRNAGITQFQFLATLDMRTSDICRSMDGEVFLVSQAQVGINVPPLHPNCRSTTIAYFKDEEDVERIARDEEGNNIMVPRKMSQEDYIRTYVPKDLQNKLLNFTKKFYKPE